MAKRGTDPFKKITLSAPHILLVEGKDDGLLVESIVRKMKSDGQLSEDVDIQVHCCWGRTNFGEQLRAIRSIAKFPETVVAVGAMRDADESEDSAFESIREAFRRNGMGPPTRIGAFTEGEAIRVGALILPGRQSSGALEDLCIRALPRKTKPCIDEFLACMGIDEANRSKAHLFAYLACCSRPGLRVGEASEAGSIDVHHAAFDDVRAFIKTMVNA